MNNVSNNILGFISELGNFKEIKGRRNYNYWENYTYKIKNEDILARAKAIEENILDSIYPLSFIDKYESFADIGTGAGYPGLILAMAQRDVKSYLIEPRIKRVSFLNFVKASLKLDNLTVLCNRVEEVKSLQVDLITSRAVTNTSLLLDITTNIKKDNSSYLFYKGSMLEEELEVAKVNDYKIVNRKDRNYLYIKGE